MNHTDLLGFNQTVDIDNLLEEASLLKEGSTQARELADRNSLEQLQDMYDQLMRDMEQEAEPEGGPIADQYADQMQDIEDAMQIKKGTKKDVPYDVAIGKMTQDEYDKYMKNKNTTSGEFNVNIPVQDEMESVNIKYGHATGPVDDVTISWAGETHNVDFEEGDVMDDLENSQIISYEAYSQGDEWRFIVDVNVDKASGEILDVDWETLEIMMDDAKMNPAIRSDFDDPIMERFQKLAGIKPLYEQGFDDRLKAAGGFSDKEFDDITSTDPNPFMDDDDPRSPGEELADRTIADFRKKYRSMSDDDLDDFSAKMVEHLLDNLAAQARAKVLFAKRGI